MEERLLTEEEKQMYLEAVAQDIFNKPFEKLGRKQLTTLHLSLIVREYHDEISTSTLHQVDSACRTRMNFKGD